MFSNLAHFILVIPICDKSKLWKYFSFPPQLDKQKITLLRSGPFTKTLRNIFLKQTFEKLQYHDSHTYVTFSL